MKAKNRGTKKWRRKFHPFVSTLFKNWTHWRCRRKIRHLQKPLTLISVSKEVASVKKAQTSKVQLPCWLKRKNLKQVSLKSVAQRHCSMRWIHSIQTKRKRARGRWMQPVYLATSKPTTITHRQNNKYLRCSRITSTSSRSISIPTAWITLKAPIYSLTFQITTSSKRILPSKNQLQEIAISTSTSKTDRL